MCGVGTNTGFKCVEWGQTRDSSVWSGDKHGIQVCGGGHLCPVCTSLSRLYISVPSVHLCPVCTSLYISVPSVHLCPVCTSLSRLYISVPSVHLCPVCTSLSRLYISVLSVHLSPVNTSLSSIHPLQGCRKQKLTGMAMKTLYSGPLLRLSGMGYSLHFGCALETTFNLPLKMY